MRYTLAKENEQGLSQGYRDLQAYLQKAAEHHINGLAPQGLLHVMKAETCGSTDNCTGMRQVCGRGHELTC